MDNPGQSGAIKPAWASDLRHPLSEYPTAISIQAVMNTGAGKYHWRVEVHRKLPADHGSPDGTRALNRKIGPKKEPAGLLMKLLRFIRNAQPYQRMIDANLR